MDVDRLDCDISHLKFGKCRFDRIEITSLSNFRRPNINLWSETGQSITAVCLTN